MQIFKRFETLFIWLASLASFFIMVFALLLIALVLLGAI